MVSVERKVTAAAAASPVVALVVFLIGQFGLKISDMAALGLVIVLTPVVTFAGGYIRTSLTSRVSQAFVLPPDDETALRRAARERHPSGGELDDQRRES